MSKRFGALRAFEFDTLSAMRASIRNLGGLRLDEFRLGDFLHEFLVECPRCAGPALVTPREARLESTLVCRKCWYSSTLGDRPATKGPYVPSAGVLGKLWPRSSAKNHVLVYGAPIDPYFHLPLWLQAPCSGGILWAYNRFHLSWLEELVGAKIRNCTTGRAYGALAHRLPRWLLSRKNRDEVLRVIGRLHRKMG